MSITPNTRRIILASGSIYRKELLSRLGIPFDVLIPDIDESAFVGELPQATALRLAEQKARAIAILVPDAIIIGSDQVASLDGQAIGKPGNHANALAQLLRMRGKRVIFHTGLCVLHPASATEAINTPQAPIIQLDDCQTAVLFRDLPEAQLDAYLHKEQPYDCAGSAKNEGLGIAILEQIDSSDPTALTGLPLITLTTMLRNLGVVFFN
jgi:septum formation protein